MSLVDGIAEGISSEEFFARQKNFSPDIIFYEVSSASYNTDEEVLKRTREIHGKSVSIIFAGPHYDMFNPEFLEKTPDVDFILIGEYEMNLLKLVEALRHGTSLNGVPALIYRDEDGRGFKPVGTASSKIWMHFLGLPVILFPCTTTSICRAGFPSLLCRSLRQGAAPLNAFFVHGLKSCTDPTVIAPVRPKMLWMKLSIV